ncbi:MAG: phosphoribosylanthranilate isomerase [Chloroflexota bacterium]|tara:strand:- start:83 stop:706 length:624 start_codon:yes stop_codon:yes gene_type:complete
MQVKICGIKNIEHAIVAIESGADFIGFIFVPESKRSTDPTEVFKIINSLKQKLPDMRTKTVGVFGNHTQQEIESLMEHSALDIAQLCGEEDFNIEIPTIRQIRIKDTDSSEAILDTVQKALLLHNYVILDSFHEKKLGGTGNIFNWEKAKNVIGLTNVLVSGGLNSKNIEDLKDRHQPYGVDVSSGVETDGVKDTGKINEFIKLAKK